MKFINEMGLRRFNVIHHRLSRNSDPPLHLFLWLFFRLPLFRLIGVINQMKGIKQGDHRARTIKYIHSTDTVSPLFYFSWNLPNEVIIRPIVRSTQKKKKKKLERERDAHCTRGKLSRVRLNDDEGL